jgi:hypothetical protein
MVLSNPCDDPKNMTYQQKQHLMMLISLKMDESDDDSTNLPIAMIDSEINHSYGWESAHNCTSSKPHFDLTRNKQKMRWNE